MKGSAKDAKDAKPAAKDAAKDAAKASSKADEDDPSVIPQPPPWYRTLRADPPVYLRLALGAALVAVILVLWWFVTRGEAHEAIISPVKLPSPGKVFGGTGQLSQAHIVDHIIDSLERVFLGILLAAVVGIGLGVLAGAHRGLNAAVAPLVIFLRSVPMGALIPLTLLLFSSGEKQKVMFIFLAVVPFVFSDTVKAVSIVPDRYIETAQTLGASNWQIIRKVLVPLALPDIITSLRFMFGLALGYIMLVEAVDADFGIGRLLNTFQREAQHLVYLVIFLIAALAFGIDLLLRTIQRGVFPWRRDL